MIKKERTLKACRELIEKYRHPKPEDVFFNCDCCPLCKIHLNTRAEVRRCLGCPLADERAKADCKNFSSYNEAVKAIFWKKCTFEKRAQFFEKIIPILEKLPAKRFTRRGWEFTGDIIPREW